jgi:hypothetical protein
MLGGGGVRAGGVAVGASGHRRGQFRILTAKRRVGTRLPAFLREMITPKVAVSRSARALPARVWQLSRLTLACDAFDDQRTGVAWSGAQAARCMSRSRPT